MVPAIPYPEDEAAARAECLDEFRSDLEQNIARRSQQVADVGVVVVTGTIAAENSRSAQVAGGGRYPAWPSSPRRAIGAAPLAFSARSGRCQTRGA